MQRKPLTGPEPSPIAHFADMADANADAHIVRDISRATESKTWRWTGQKPELRFLLTTTENLKFSMDFAVPEITFAQRGPVSISIFVNDRLLDTVRCEKGGERHFEKPVPPEWLRTHLPNLVVHTLLN